MITQKDQDNLFALIAKNLTKDVDCIAFGGTAMMYYDFKQATKDIDLVFKTIEDRKIFTQVIETLGYKEDKKLLAIYSNEKRVDTTAPVMYTLQDERFDLFAQVIFKVNISKTMLDRATLIQDFQEDHRLRIHIISPADLVLLKALTDRKNDFEDIQTILSKVTPFDWEPIILEAKSQPDGWILLDLEKKMQRLQETTFIPQKYFEALYK